MEVFLLHNSIIFNKLLIYFIPRDTLIKDPCKPRQFPGGPVVRTPRFHCWGPGFDPWSENKDPASYAVLPKKKKNPLQADTF